MAKIAIKSEKLTPFGGIFTIMDRFESVISPVVDSTLGRPFLDDRQFDKGSKELDRLTSNFPSVMEEVNRIQNRGFRR